MSYMQSFNANDGAILVVAFLIYELILIVRPSAGRARGRGNDARRLLNLEDHNIPETGS
jgi:hypothetical protein